MIVIHVLVSVAINLLAQKNITFPVEISLVLSELTILIPAFIYALKKNLSFTNDIGFKPVKVSTFFMCILLSFLVTPISSFVNVLSQLFVSNTMVAAADTLSSGSGVAVLFLGAVYGPLCEEFVFRGVFDNRYERFAGPLTAGLVSALYFALIHLNVNQAMYTFVLGVIFSIINRAAGSIFPSVIIHACINGGNIALLLLLTSVYKTLGKEGDIVASAEAARKSDAVYILAGATFVTALICTAIAVPCVVFVAKNEGRLDTFRKMFTKNQEEKHRWFTVSAAIAIGFALFVMFGLKMLLPS